MNTADSGLTDSTNEAGLAALEAETLKPTARSIVDPGTGEASQSSSPSSPDSEKRLSADEGGKQPDARHDSAEADYFSLIIRDGLDIPIHDLEVFITLPSGEVCSARSTEAGAVTVPRANAEGSAKVEVKDAAGQRQTVCELDLAKCRNAVIVRSPKVKVDVPLRPHQQTSSVPAHSSRSNSESQTNKSGADRSANSQSGGTASGLAHTWWGANGSMEKAWAWLKTSVGVTEQPPIQSSKDARVQTTLNHAGQPVTVVAGPECPNKDGLRLGQYNDRYRVAIVDASKRLGLIPQALCALIDCEAGKVPVLIPKVGPDGKPLKNKQGKPLTTKIGEQWDANAGNAQSGAAGLTQFLASTWLSHVLTPGRYIHDQSIAKGWVRRDADKAKKRWVFVLADEKSTATTKPYDHRATDAHVQACLAMRMDPTWSINAAADYGASNLSVLKDAGFKLNDLNDMDKAKLMYLMHHEGEGDGPAFIRGALCAKEEGAERLKRKFAKQLGSNGATLCAEKIDQTDGDVQVAYRRWLSDYIDKVFSHADKYFCSDPEPIDRISNLMVRIGGKSIT